MIKKFALTLAVAGSLAAPVGCTLDQNDTNRIGGLTLVGAAAGGLIGGDLQGALLGAAVGATTGAVLVATDDRGTCYYRRPNGTYVKNRCT